MTKAKPEYTVVARRYRPQQFDDLVGQEPVARALKNALTGDRVAHAYLFTGARGVGKTSTARILAKALNCEKGPTPTPCDACSSCQAIAAGDDIDVREIDGASNRGIDDIRAIRQDVATRPTRSRYKIYIIDEVHMLSKDAFNALLKTLEEPPAHVKFIFATTEHQKVPITILSRCQRFDFGNISVERIANQLRAIVAAEQMQADDDALDIIARRAGGSMRDAQSLLDQLLAFGGERLSAETVQHLLGVAGPDRVMALANAIMARDARAVLDQLDSLAEHGLPTGELLDQLIDHWRDLMLVGTAGKDARQLTTPSRFRAELERQATSAPLDTILAGLDILIAAKQRQRGGGHAQTQLQLALIRLCRLADLTPLSQLALWLSQPETTAGAMKVRSAPSAGPARTLATPPEGKKKPTTDPPATSTELTAESLPSIWPEVLAQAGLILSGQLQRAGLPAISGPKSLVITFPPEYNAAYEHCVTPANVQRIEQALRRRVNLDWMIKLELGEGRPGTRNGTGGALGSPQPARVRPQEMMLQYPILQRALEVFDALPLFVDPEFGTAESPPATLVTPVVNDSDEEAP